MRVPVSGEGVCGDLEVQINPPSHGAESLWVGGRNPLDQQSQCRCPSLALCQEGNCGETDSQSLFWTVVGWVVTVTIFNETEGHFNRILSHEKNLESFIR